MEHRRLYHLPRSVMHSPSRGICAQSNLRSALWAALRAGYTRADLQAEVKRALKIGPKASK